MAKVDFKKFISKYPVYNTTCKLLKGTVTEISDVKDDIPFFVEPNFEEIATGNNHSPFVVVTAPGATGKSALSKYLCIKQNALYWNLSKSVIGNNYFIGTISKAFGPGSLSQALSDLSSGKLGFIIDAFDEAEISCGWIRIQGFIEEIKQYTKSSPSHSITIVARQATAEYLRILLEDLFGTNSYYCYRINFFTKEQARLFLINSLKIAGVHPQSSQQKRMFEVFDVIVSGVDNVLSEKREINEYPFYGYAPVLQAIAVLFRANTNYQELQNEFIKSDFSELLKTIITNILLREQKKFVEAFIINSSVGGISKAILDKLFSIDEQVYYLAQYVNGLSCNVNEKIKNYGMSGTQIMEYQKSINSFINQHPFLLENNSFASPVFHDYCYALLLAKYEANDSILISINRELPQITRMFMDFYLAETGNKIDGQHIGILYSSLVSILNSETLATIYGKDDDIKLSSPLIPNDIDICGHNGLVFPNLLRNIYINVDRDVILASFNGDFLLYNTEIQTTGNIIFQGKNLEVICNENDKPILLKSEKSFIYPSDDIVIKKYGSGDFITSFPGGNIYPFVDYHRDIENIEEKNTDNAFLALRQILRWFRRDRRDSIARYAALIDNVFRGNKVAQEMLKYMINERVLWKDGVFYKMAAKEAERKGINFTVLQSAEGKTQLRTFLDGFVKVS